MSTTRVLLTYQQIGLIIPLLILAIYDNRLTYALVSKITRTSVLVSACDANSMF